MSEDEHRYQMKSRWVQKKIVTVETDGKNSFNVATPPDFWPESPSGLLSPEDLFLASAVSCYGVSLHGVSQRFHVEFTDFQLSGSGTLQKGDYGWEFAEINIAAKIFITTESDRNKMSKAAERAHTYCVVANSMKCPVHLQYDIIVGQGV
jgi:organic hydroperoxide reductase OsmC/OhrA